MAATLVGRGLDLAFALLYFRVLGDEGTAPFKFLVVLTTYLDTLVNFGLNTILARDVARAPGAARAAFRAVATLRLGLWLLGLPLVALVLGPLREAAELPPEAVPAGWLFYLALVPSILSATATGLFWAAERLEIPASVSILTALLKVAIGGAALLLGFGLIGLAGGALLVNVLTAAILLVLLLRLRLVHLPSPSTRGEAHSEGSPLSAQSSALRTEHSALRPLALVRESWPLFVNQLLAGLFFRIDLLLLPGLAGTRPASVYAAAYTVIEGVGVISSSFTLAIFPRLARRAASGELAYAYRLSLRLLLQVAFPLMAGIALLSEPIVGLLAGAEFLPEGATALALLIFFLPFSFANGLGQYVLIALGRQRFLTGVFLAAVVFNVAANLALIPRYGFVGAALVTVASELVLLAPFQWALRRSLPTVSLIHEVRAPLLATLLMAPVAWWLRDALHPTAAIAAGALLYPLALWALGGIDEDEWRLLRTLTRRDPRPVPFSALSTEH